MLQEKGALEPDYENISWYDSEAVEYSVTFKIPSNAEQIGMTHFSLCGLMPQGTTEYEACEDIARHALGLLQDEHGINVLFYTSLAATQGR